MLSRWRGLPFVLALLFSLNPALACDPSQFIVAVDIGPTTQSPGATSARGRPEWPFNQALAQQVIDALHVAGFSASVLINANGRISSLGARLRQAEKAQADLFLSIHHDSVQPRYLKRWTVEGVSRRYSDRFQGYSLFVSGQNPHFAASRRFAVLTGQALTARGMSPSLHHAEAIPGENRPLLDPKLGIYRYDNLYVVHHAPMPALLLEAGLIVNRDEELQLKHPAYQQKIAAGLVAAVTAFCQETNQTAPTSPQSQ